MPFKYHPPTGRNCEICEWLAQHDPVAPIVDSHNGKASSASNFPFHNWYHFVLGYSPQFPEYMLQREKVIKQDFVVDPFMGTGTTLISCKLQGIPAGGIDANDFMVEAASIKTNWNIDLTSLKKARNEILLEIEKRFASYCWNERDTRQLSLFTSPNVHKDYTDLLQYRPKMLEARYLSDKPFAKALLIANIIDQLFSGELAAIFRLALTSIIVPISNIKYGPGFGITKPKDDVDVLSIFTAKIGRMVQDLENVSEAQRNTSSSVQLGDARLLSSYFEANTASLMITSPPYPGDHEYTKHTKLELLFRGYATNHSEFQVIKKRMLRASTTNIYKEDNDRFAVDHINSIRQVTDLIQERLDQDGATSGFEKLYTKLVWEYFGGMSKALTEAFTILRPGGKIALLVSDSHAFKMVHIQTTAILQEIGLELGYVNPEIILWQNKVSTSHRYHLRENIIILQKP